MVFPYLSSHANVIANLIWHIKHYQQLKDVKVVLKSRFQFLLNLCLPDMHVQIQ